MEMGDKADHVGGAELISSPSSMPNGTSKHLRVSLPNNIKQLIKEMKQIMELVTVITRIDGKVPSLNTFFEWTMSTFSQTVQTLFIRGHGYFEIEFKSEADKSKALLEGPFSLHNNSISISPWSPSLNTIIPTSIAALKHPTWVQFYGLNSPLRCDLEILQFAQKIGEVLHIESLSSYRHKTSRQRVYISVTNLENLSKRIFPDIEDMSIDDGVLMEYFGLFDQCGRCRKMVHDSKLCPKDIKNTQKDHNTMQTDSLESSGNKLQLEHHKILLKRLAQHDTNN